MSGALDDDTAQTIASGRQSIRAMLGAAQQNLQRAFIIFLIFWLGAFYALRLFVWDRLKKDLVYNRMSDAVAEQTQIVAVNPFEVILLQIKISVAVGIIAIIPVVVYYSRDSLRARGHWPSAAIPKWKIWGFLLTIALLAVGGMIYGYLVFFPIMFDFLASNAVQSGFKPTWSIALWTEFIFFLMLSFGIAAQLPLAMSSLARAGIVGYETFRDKWRYAVVGIVVFGAFFSPPDPFTQLMWAAPLVVLYFISLGITRFAVLSKQASEAVPVRAVARERWNVLAGSFVLAAGATYVYLLEGGLEATNSLLSAVGSGQRFPTASELGIGPLSPTETAVAFAFVIGLVVGGVVLFYLRIVELEEHTSQEEREAALAGDIEGDDEDKEETETKTPDPGDPATVQIPAMSADALETVPLEEFARLDQEQVLERAQAAVDDDNPRKARLLMDRFEESQEIELPEEAQEENVVQSTATGVADAFTDEDTDEDDIGGYYYDLTFILQSLTSRAIWVVATFMVVMVATFTFLYLGGIATIQDIFFQNMPAEVVEEPEIVVLHPVEALIFMLKFSMLMGGVATLPVATYLAWPAVKERGFAPNSDRNILLVWGGSLAVSLFGGFILGFLYIAPTVISLLAWDVVQSNMIIAYRINSFGWLVIYLTVGIGFLAMIPTTMLLFHHGNIIGYRRMRKSWRGVVAGFFVAGGLLSPNGIFTMFLVAIPAGLAYGLGLGVLWVYTGVESRVPTSWRGETAD